ncbi:MAG: DUF3575 domain-containing protein [Dysgonamonadaceae bacterium]|nr:DUF3575 domain-containing protein [Dysgonamonadaceae bacterium]
MVKIFLLFVALSAQSANAQIFIKGNCLYWLALMPDLQVETRLSDHFTASGEGFCSLWQSINGNPVMVGMLTPDVRWYPKSSFIGFYLGAYTSGNIFKLSKPGYYWNHHLYQKGYSFGYGATAGYELKLSDKWMLEATISYGRNMARYKGYFQNGEPYIIWNGSAEWLPYRFGIVIGYRIG